MEFGKLVCRIKQFENVCVGSQEHVLIEGAYFLNVVSLEGANLLD